MGGPHRYPRVGPARSRRPHRGRARLGDTSVDEAADGITATLALYPLDLNRPIESETFPDAFSYTFEVEGRAMTVPQQELSDDQRALAALLLAPPT